MLSNRPRCCRSSTSALNALSSSGSFVSQRREAVLVQIPAAGVHFDERHADFHQPPGHQAAAAEVVVAVLLQHVLRLAADLERLHLLAGQQVAASSPSTLACSSAAAPRRSSMNRVSSAAEQLHAVVHPLPRHAHLARRGSGRWRRPGTARTPCPRSPALRSPRRSTRTAESPARGTLLFHLVGDHRAVARVLDARVRHEAGVHVVAAAIVVGLARAHRAHDRQVLHLLGQLRHQLADLEVAGRGDRLELRRPSARRASCPTYRSSAARRPATAESPTCDSRLSDWAFARSVRVSANAGIANADAPASDA